MNYRLTVKSLSRAVVTLAIAGISASFIPAAFAAEATLEEVIVTARKMEESMQDVSVAVTAFSGQQIDNLVMRDIREIEGLVPNLVIDTLGSVAPSSASIYIRGVGTQEVERSFDPAVGVVIDGVPLSYANGSLANTFDFQSMEILRGPQGTLFGRNTTGGVINITRTLPTGELGMRYEGTAGTDDLVDFKGVVNFPLGDMFSGKLGYAAQKDGTERENVTIGKDVGKPDNREYNATLLFRPNDDFDALLTYVHYKDENDGVPLQNRSSTNENNNVHPEPEIPCSLEILILLGFCGDDVTDIEKLSQDFYPDDIDFKWDSYTLNMNYDVGVGVITGIFGYQETDEEVPTDFDATAGNFFHAWREQDSDQTTAEIRFASSDELSDRWNFVAGAFYVDDKYKLEQFTSIAAGAGPADALFQNPKADHERDGWAVFGEFHYDLTDQLMLILGGRYMEEEKDYTGSIRFAGNDGAAGPDVPLAGYMGNPDDFYIYGQPVWVPIDSASADEDWDEFTPKVGLDYRVNDDVLTYIVYSEGFRSGGFNGRNQNLANIGPFDPETVENWELGMKSELLDNTLRLNMAAYYNEYDDKQEEIIEPDGFGGSNTVVRNASTAELWGVEAEATWIASANLLFNANVGYQDAEYDSFSADLNGDGIVTDNSNLKLRRTPDWTGGVNGTYTLAIGPGDLSVYASYRYTDEYWVDVDNDPRSLLNDRGVVDATIAYEWDWSEGRSIRIAVWGRDITDEVEYSSMVVVPEAIAFSGVSGGEQYGVRISGNF